MTIAKYCLNLLREDSPRTAQELAESCLAAGVTRARSPITSVTYALMSHEDVAPLLPGGRYGFTPHVLEGSWFTTRQRNGDRLPASFDLALLQRLVAHEEVRLVSGGVVRSSLVGDGLSGPEGWLPEADEDQLLGLRLVNGALDVQAVVLEDQAVARGQDLAGRLRARTTSRGGWSLPEGLGRERAVWAAMVRLLAEEPNILATPVAPLSELLPDMLHRPETQVQLSEPMVLSLPASLRERLQRLADAEGIPLSRWLGDELQQLALRGGGRHMDDVWTGSGEGALPTAPLHWPFRVVRGDRQDGAT